jgi:hypothetical protein
MKSKITQGVAAFAALGALALGGSAVAGAVQNNATAPVVKQAPSKAQENTSGPDTDSIQSGDQTTPDKAKEAPGTEQSAASERSSSNEAPGTEQSPASESGSESSSEVAGNDGPGGHADEPGNANADHQAQGQE